ncbi:MAG: hypothetical protein KatS3mg071_2743 [Meiothermus sp.]|nr:MAG: hypothetical protein KatS3mg071_2743 [Meiothermus sp.]
MRFFDDFATFPVGGVPGSYTADITNAWSRPQPWGQWEISNFHGRNWLRFSSFRDTVQAFISNNKMAFRTGIVQTQFILRPGLFDNVQPSILARYIPNPGASYQTPRDGIRLRLYRFSNVDNRLELTATRGGLNIVFSQTPLLVDWDTAYDMILQVTDDYITGEILQNNKSLALIGAPLLLSWEGQIGFAVDADGSPSDPGQALFANLRASEWSVVPVRAGWDTRPGPGGKVSRYLKGLEDSDSRRSEAGSSTLSNPWLNETSGEYLDDQRRIYV